MDDGRAVAAIPDVVPLAAVRQAHRAVSEPEGAMMRMVPFLPFQLSHRPVAGERLAAWPVDRIEVRQVGRRRRHRRRGRYSVKRLPSTVTEDAIATTFAEFDHRFAFRRERRRAEEDQQAKQRNGDSG